MSGLDMCLLWTETTTKWFKKLAGGKLVSLRRARRHPRKLERFPTSFAFDRRCSRRSKANERCLRNASGGLTNFA